MASATSEAIHFGHGLLTRFGATSVPARAAQVWANGGVLVAVATGSIGATIVWLIGVLGLVAFHGSRAIVVVLERRQRRDRFEVLYREAAEDLRRERERHAQDRALFLQTVERLTVSRAIVAIDVPPALVTDPVPAALVIETEPEKTG